MKKNNDEWMMQRFDRLENKIDRLVEEIIPALKVDMATVKTSSSTQAKIITAIGGAITLAVSIAAAHWMK